MSQHINSKTRDQYIKLLELELYKKYPGKKQAEIAALIGFGVTTHHNVFSKKSGTDATIEQIARKVGFTTLSQYGTRKPLLDRIEKRILEGGGAWVSYCFNKRRRLYESMWTFTKEERKDSLEGVTEFYIEAVRDTVDERYVGELIIHLDMTLSICAKSSAGLQIEHFTRFSDDIDESFCNSMNYLLLEASVVRRKEFFTSLEVLAKIEVKNAIVPKTIAYEDILPDFDEDFIPRSHAYLAFNYLTRHVSKSRRLLDNCRINERPQFAGPLLYTHDIFIACPLTYIKEVEEFVALKQSVTALIKVLKNDLGFRQENIHCGILQHETLEDIRRDDRYKFFESRKFVGSTHFIALIPEGLKGSNSGIYMEIYFRILKKLPALVFVENKKQMPSLLRGLIDTSDRPLNIAFRDSQVSDVAEYVKMAKRYIFQYSL